MKTCRKCGGSEDEGAEFEKHRRVCKACRREYNRKRMRRVRSQDPGYDLRTKHGIEHSPEDHRDLLESQGYRCAICRKVRPLVVDHCHDAEEVRGLLCQSCNTAIGLLDEDPRILYSATRFVAAHAERRIKEETP